MGCSFSGLNAFYDAMNGGGDVWINENRFRIVRQLGEGGFAYVYLVKELQTDASAAADETSRKKFKDPSQVSVHLDGTLLDNAKAKKSRKEIFPPITVLQIFRQLCAGLKHVHSFNPPYAHNNVKPGNVLITNRKGKPSCSSNGFRKCWACQEGNLISFRGTAIAGMGRWPLLGAPELWDCPSHADMDERMDIWSLGCTLYAIMYGGVSPFEYALGESG